MLLLLAAAGACGGPPADAAGPVEAGGIQEREVPPVRPCTLEQRPMVRILDATSKLESDREVDLYPELPGTAVEILVEEGDRVREGDVLARLDHRQEDLAVRDAEVALAESKEALVLAALAVEEATDQVENAAKSARQAERDYQRDEQLFRSEGVVNPLSQQQLEARRLERDRALHAEEQAKIVLRRRELERDAAETAISRAEVTLERARLDRSRKEIVAPFDGVISLRNIRVGDSVGTGLAAFVLTDTENLRATFSRPQEELELFARLGGTDTAGRPANGDAPHAEETEDGLTIRATAEAYPGRVFEGWVERISPTIDAVSGQFRVVARLRRSEGTEAELLPGMLVRMEIVTDRHPRALVAPKRALRREGERRFVLAIEESGGEEIVRRIDVREGFEDDESVELLPLEEGSLRPGMRLVLVGSRDLRDGDPVRVDELDQAVAAERP